MTTPLRDPTSSRDFRHLLGCFATGVTVATALDEHDRPVGMTASAVSSVSLDPPLLLVCVSKDARFHGALLGRRGFALNVLAEDQTGLSDYFAQRLDDAFRDVAFAADPTGAALLDGVVAHIVCEPYATFDAGPRTAESPTTACRA